MIRNSEVFNKRIFEIRKTHPSNPRTHINWDKQLDNSLKQIVLKHDGKNWKGIAREMQEKYKDMFITAKKCRERWTCRVNPAVKKGPLTDAEMTLLLVYHASAGNNWLQLSKAIQNRHNNTLKNNFYSMVRSIVRKMAAGEIERTTALYLLESIYVSNVVAELLKKPEESSYGRSEMPPHLRSLVAKKAVTVEMCENYLKKVVASLVSRNAGRPMLRYLRQYTTLADLHKLFIAMASRLKLEVRSLAGNLSDLEITDAVESLILAALEAQVAPPLLARPSYVKPIISFKGNVPAYPYVAEIVLGLPGVNCVAGPRFEGGARGQTKSANGCRCLVTSLCHFHAR